MSINAAREAAGLESLPAEKPANARLRSYLAYRRAELESEERNIANAGYSGIGGGSMISRGERLRVVTTLLEELQKLAEWLEAGEPRYVPPLSAADLKQWQWAKEHGMAVPAHIEAQL